jgi:hypothetical protein
MNLEIEEFPVVVMLAHREFVPIGHERLRVQRSGIVVILHDDAVSV